MDNFALIAEQRRRVADTLAGLTDDQWSEPSLCGDWTVQHVAGHLSSGWNISTPRFIRGLVRARGSFNNANARFGRELGARSTEEIIADLRANAEHTFTPPGAGSEAPLADVLVHAQDMFIPLGISYDVDPATVVPVMDASSVKRTEWMRGTDVARRFELRATDTNWHRPNPGKPTLEGPVLALLLMLFGRTAAHSQINGPVDEI